MALPPLDLNDIWLPNEPREARPDRSHWWRRSAPTVFRENTSHWYGEDWADRLCSGLGISDPNPHEWAGVRPLGQGGFGWAALYERRVNGTGPVTDHVVIKETRTVGNPMSRPNYWSQHSGQFVPLEASIMAQMNDQNNPNIVRLRTFKRYLSNDGRTKDRFFLECCPHGDLYDLRFRYRNFGEFFPEAFLWHIFDSLANAAMTFKEVPWVGVSTAASGRPDSRNEIIHLDFKSTNIFLGDPIRDGPNPAFPSIKVGDFGLAQITFERDPYNPRDLHGGTDHLRPPEQEDTCTRGRNNSIDEWWLGNEKPWSRCSWYNEKHNVFGIGLVMWEMLTLDTFYLRCAYKRGRKQYPDGHFMKKVSTMRGDDRKPGKKVNSKTEEEYSPHLRKLVRQCLHPDPAKRPTARVLFEKTQRYLAESAAEHSKPIRRYKSGPRKGEAYNKKTDPNSLYYRGNEINDMIPGTLFFPLFDYSDEGIGRGGWISTARHWRQSLEPDPGVMYNFFRGMPGAPIVYPKLRWKPAALAGDFWLTKKRQKYNTRRGSNYPPPLSNLYVEVEDKDGRKKIELLIPDVYSAAADRHREKDVWIAGKAEYGSINTEARETAEAEQIEYPGRKPRHPPQGRPGHHPQSSSSFDDDGGDDDGGDVALHQSQAHPPRDSRQDAGGQHGHLLSMRHTGHGIGMGARDARSSQDNLDMAAIHYNHDFPHGWAQIETNEDGILSAFCSIRLTMEHMHPGIVLPSALDLMDVVTAQRSLRHLEQIWQDDVEAFTVEDVATILRLWGRVHYMQLNLGVIHNRDPPWFVEQPNTPYTTTVWVHLEADVTGKAIYSGVRSVPAPPPVGLAAGFNHDLHPEDGDMYGVSDDVGEQEDGNNNNTNNIPSHQSVAHGPAFSQITPAGQSHGLNLQSTASSLSPSNQTLEDTRPPPPPPPLSSSSSKKRKRANKKAASATSPTPSTNPPQSRTSPETSPQRASPPRNNDNDNTRQSQELGDGNDDDNNNSRDRPQSQSPKRRRTRERVSSCIGQ